jgi:hypothetical protein
MIRMKKKQGDPRHHVNYGVRVPLTFTYHSLPGLEVIETHTKQLDLPILSWHITEIKFLVKKTNESPEQVLLSLIKVYVEEKRAQFQKEHPEYHLTITMNGEPAYSKEVKELLELLKQ